jgi:hypothetical protein
MLPHMAYLPPVDSTMNPATPRVPIQAALLRLLTMQTSRMDASSPPPD